MATHRITLTTVGSGISTNLDLSYWDGDSWVLIASVPKTSFQGGGYQFENNTGATQFKVADTGVCGTEHLFYCEGEPPTTTEAPTTTDSGTTEEPATTVEPTTTATPIVRTINYTVSGSVGNGRIEVMHGAVELLNIATNNSIRTGSIVVGDNWPYTVTAYNTNGIDQVAKLRVCGQGTEMFYDADITTVEGQSAYAVNPTPDTCDIHATFDTVDTPDECVEPTTTLIS
jgi:hypothetical protein